MKRILSSPSEVRQLSPLLRSIAREIHERSLCLEHVEACMRAVTGKSRPDPREVGRLTAEAATQRRELRYSRAELERLGCKLVRSRPLTLRFPVRQEGSVQRFEWRADRGAVVSGATSPSAKGPERG